MWGPKGTSVSLFQDRLALRDCRHGAPTLRGTNRCRAIASAAS